MESGTHKDEYVLVRCAVLERMKGMSDELHVTINALAHSSKTVGANGADSGELVSIRDRLERLSKQLTRIGASSHEKKGKHLVNRTSHSTNGSSSTVLAEIRLILEGVEDTIANLLPHSGGTPGHTQFFGQQRVSEVDASAIRSDFQSFGRDEVFVRWCFDKASHPKGGLEGGRGTYTKRQVSAVLANDVGGHRRRRGVIHSATAV